MDVEALRKDRTKGRTCLRCQATFQSTGPENRICPTCTNKETAAIKKGNAMTRFPVPVKREREEKEI